MYCTGTTPAEETNSNLKEEGREGLGMHWTDLHSLKVSIKTEVSKG